MRSRLQQAFIGLVILTLPVSLPLVVVYKWRRGEQVGGKGAAFLCTMWIVMTAAYTLAIAAYVNDGLVGLRTVALLVLALALWACIIMLVLQALFYVIAAVLRRNDPPQS